MPLHAPPASIPQPGTGTDAGRPLTRQDVVDLEQRREALLLELAAVQTRHSAAIGELQTIRASPLRDRPGRVNHANLLEQEIAQLEGRSARIGADLEEAGRRLSTGFVASQIPPLPPPPTPPMDFPFELLAGVAIVFIVVAVGPISLALARLIWKRATAPRGANAAWDSNPRLDRLEQSVDAIAVEVERISEGQRYMTRLLAEAPSFAVGAARAPVPEHAYRPPAGKSPPDER